jgi:hypothetical protein
VTILLALFDLAMGIVTCNPPDAPQNFSFRFLRIFEIKGFGEVVTAALYKFGSVFIVDVNAISELDKLIHGLFLS